MSSSNVVQLPSDRHRDVILYLTTGIEGHTRGPLLKSVENPLLAKAQNGMRSCKAYEVLSSAHSPAYDEGDIILVKEATRRPKYIWQDRAILGGDHALVRFKDGRETLAMLGTLQRLETLLFTLDGSRMSDGSGGRRYTVHPTKVIASISRVIACVRGRRS
jgi:hypothetical protein